MPSSDRNLLPPRLTRKSEFIRIMRAGKKFGLSFLRISIHPSLKKNTGQKKRVGENITGGRVGFVITERAVRGSVNRNRVKRLMREAVRHWWRYIKHGYDIILKTNSYPRIDHALYVETIVIKLLIKADILTGEGQVRADERLSELPEEYVREKSRKKSR